MRAWFRSRPLAEAPAHFPDEFRRTFNEITAALGDKATADRAVDIEAATLLLESLRATGPDWPTDRYDLLLRLLQRLRS